MGLTKSLANNIRVFDGNSLAVFIDATNNKLSLRDIYGKKAKIEDFETGIVASVTTDTPETINIGGTAANPTVNTKTNPVIENGTDLAIGGQIYDFVIGLGYTTCLGTVTSVGIETGTSGTDVSVSGSPITGSGDITLNIPIASATNTGKLSSADWSTFNSKTTCLGTVTGTGTTNFLSKFTGASSLGNSLVFDNGTNVGIGTTIPSSELEVVGDIALSGGGFRQLSSCGLSIVGYSNTTFDFTFGNESIISNIDTNSITFNTLGTPRMSITSAGNVGIGVTNPLSVLHIKSGTGTITSETTAARNSNNNFLSFRDDSGDAGFVGYGANSSDYYFWNILSGDTLFGTANTESMRITSAGNVGIGTTSPTNKLEVTGGNNVGISIFNTTANYWDINNGVDGTLEFIRGKVNKYFIINQNGNVGIGTTSPADRLKVVGGSDVNTGIALTDGGADVAKIDFRVSDDSTRASLSNGDTNSAGGDSLKFKVFSSGLLNDVMTLRGAGNVGIGTTSPSEKLDVNGNINADSFIKNGGTSSEFLMADGSVSSGGSSLEGTQYIYVTANGTDTENATELQSAYDTAKTMSPSATNRITVICGNGNYNFSSNFVMDTQYIDLVSLDGNRSIIFNGTGTISITANDVFVKGVDVGTKSFTIANDLNLLKVENCQGGGASFGGFGTAPGTFINCKGGNLSFGSFFGTASGTFIDCQGGDGSFGGEGTAPGTFINCQGGNDSFGASFGTASGTFINCQGGNNSFGGFFGTAFGTFTDCQGGDNSFGGFGGAASGTFTNCQGGNGSFGGEGLASGTLINCQGGNFSFGGFATASGTFINCQGGNDSFGGGGFTASGTFTDCQGGDNSFGGFGTASGIFTYCIGGNRSFAQEEFPGASPGVLSGKLYYCRLTVGTFETVSGAGITRLCIDGNNNENNQG